MKLEDWVAQLENLDTRLCTFLQARGLSDTKILELAFENPYRGGLQRHNLLQRLRVWQDCGDPFLFVGEAPGYKGCQICGIPFASEKVLLDPANNFALKNYPATLPSDSSQQNISQTTSITDNLPYRTIGQSSEQSATIMWRAFRENHLNVATWNAYPFHPYNPTKGPASNRTPHHLEIEFGYQILKELIAILQVPLDNIYAVGRSAQKSLNLDDDDHTIRHPANGGATACTAKIAAIAKEYRANLSKNQA